jgi:hypothetical protein
MSLSQSRVGGPDGISRQPKEAGTTRDRPSRTFVASDGVMRDGVMQAGAARRGSQRPFDPSSWLVPSAARRDGPSHGRQFSQAEVVPARGRTYETFAAWPGVTEPDIAHNCRVTPGAQYCTAIGQRKVHHLPGR